jgi:hypothetical protein
VIPVTRTIGALLIATGSWGSAVGASTAPQRVPEVKAWKPIGNTTFEPTGARGVRARTVRRGSPNRTAGIHMPIGAVKAGDLLRVRLTYQTVRGGALRLLVGTSPTLGIAHLDAATETEIEVDFPVRKAGAWNLWIRQPMNRRKGEFTIHDLSARVVEQGLVDRFPVVIDGDMEQAHSHFYSHYGLVRADKVTDDVRSGRRSLRVRSLESDRPSSVYAGTSAHIGVLPAGTKVHVAFDIKVAKGELYPIMARGAFDKRYPLIKPGNWQHVELDYETPYNAWYTIYWTRYKDIEIDFLLDNLVVTVRKPTEEKKR